MPTPACRYLRRFRYFTTADRAIRRLATETGDPVTRFEPLECGACGAIHIWDQRAGPPPWPTRRHIASRIRHMP